MLYKPNYCCNCGEKIERVEWNPLTNRRFCEVCETEHPLDKLLKITFPVILVVVGVFGISGYFQGGNTVTGLTDAENSGTLQNDIRQRKSANLQTLKSSDEADLKNDNNESQKRYSDVQTQSSKAAADRRNSEIDETQEVFIAKSPQKAVGARTYFCGAETKKGTPCSRKVKGGGRCWQHKGREALLPDKELSVENY